MTTNQYEVVFAIVNSGYAEEAMEVAREQGVRGGTILNARGVARADEAAFFGISIHHEKEILMMVVEKTIKDQVLNALYKDMGMAKKAQGIADGIGPKGQPFILPCPVEAAIGGEPVHRKR